MNLLTFNPVLTATLGALIVAQLFKVLITYWIERRLNIARMIDVGGMPSTHSAFVTGLATSVGVAEGFYSPYFALSVVLAGIVIYDAMGIRKTVGEHAEFLNQLLGEIFKGGGAEDENYNIFKVALGHTFLEVFVGGIIGIASATLFMKYLQ